MSTTLILCATALVITAMLCRAASRAWQGWLELKRHEHAAACDPTPSEDDAGLRIELAAVRERLRKLEEIASGVEL